ncbi:hypothetical protein [Streptomyces sp. NPDC059863]|uniref:hypothetical protein n=1 Tax=unclassified Streptomyces TaxID=2593676 RepID=UPI0036652597
MTAVQAAVTAHAEATGQNRYEVEKELKRVVRHPEPDWSPIVCHVVAPRNIGHAPGPVATVAGVRTATVSTRTGGYFPGAGIPLMGRFVARA